MSLPTFYLGIGIYITFQLFLRRLIRVIWRVTPSFLKNFPWIFVAESILKKGADATFLKTVRTKISYTELFLELKQSDFSKHFRIAQHILFSAQKNLYKSLIRYLQVSFVVQIHLLFSNQMLQASCRKIALEWNGSKELFIYQTKIINLSTYLW